MLRLLAAGVGFLAVAVAKTGIKPQRDACSGREGAQLVDHVGRTAVDVDAVFDNQAQRLALENVGRINDWRRITFGDVSGGQSSADLARAHRVDEHSISPHQVQDRQGRAGLLSVSDQVERLEVFDPLDDLGGVVKIARRAELSSQLIHVAAGDLAADGGKLRRSRHRKYSCKVQGV
jgi:hypothetical protein